SHAMTWMLLMEETGFHVKIESSLAAAGLDAGNALHLGWRLQVLEVVGLVDEDVIDGQLVKDQSVILFVLGEKVLEAFAAGGLLLLDCLDEIPVGALGRCVFAQQLVIFRNLVEQEL